MHSNDDFGFSEYIDTPRVEVLPPAFPKQGFCKPPASKFRFAGLKISKQAKLQVSFMVLLASTVLFGSSVIIARSSDRLDQWRHHSLQTAQSAGLFMTVSAALTFYFLGGKGDE